jgi:hypothetical protein
MSIMLAKFIAVTFFKWCDYWYMLSSTKLRAYAPYKNLLDWFYD